MKIGLIRLSSLGDVVLATSCLKPLRRRHSGSEVFFLTRSEYVDVFRNNSYLNRVIAWEKGEPFKGLLSRVREECFDVLVDLHSTPRSHSITALSGSKRVIRYEKSHIARRLSVLRKKKPKVRHVVERYMDALGALGVEARESLPAIYPGREDSEWVSDFLGEHGGTESILVCIAPGGRKKTKRWPAHKFAEVARKLSSRQSASVVMVGDVNDIPVGREVLNESPAVIDGIGKTDIGRLGALLSRCDLVISNDSAPVHIAVATGTPVVAIFGPTIVEFGFAPLGRGSTVVAKDLYCRPCSLHGTEKCPEGHFRCMEEISGDEVYDVAARVLAERG